MVMDMEEGQARTTFHKLAESLWLIGSRGSCGTGSGIDRNSLSRSGKTGG